MLGLDADALADLHAPDAVFEFPLLAPNRPERYVGREEIRAGFRAVWSAAPVRVNRIERVSLNQSTDPEVIIAEQLAHATHTGTGAEISLPSLLMLRVRAGSIVHVRDYSDALRSALELGRLADMINSLTPGADRNAH
ncbi:nuclear transport factor 2 family protein [Pseudonocardiaceae bacterium YIM PH 21723]|nr:nuclear transport factor 2 family protein [Pseudonocardiaceae bacterium YIM PH 21723]